MLKELKSVESNLSEFHQLMQDLPMVSTREAAWDQLEKLELAVEKLKIKLSKRNARQLPLTNTTGKQR